MKIQLTELRQELIAHFDAALQNACQARDPGAVPMANLNPVSDELKAAIRAGQASDDHPLVKNLRYQALTQIYSVNNSVINQIIAAMPAACPAIEPGHQVDIKEIRYQWVVEISPPSDAPTVVWNQTRNALTLHNLPAGIDKNATQWLISSYGFLIPKGPEPITLEQWAQKIEAVYDKTTPQTACATNMLRKWTHWDTEQTEDQSHMRQRNG